MGVRLLIDLAGAAAVEEAETAQLITVEPSGRRTTVRFAHPLFGEALRAPGDGLRARRLRGDLAEALAATGARRSGDTLHRALLLADSDRVPDPELLAAGARVANGLLDVRTGERLERAAVEAGAGADAVISVGLALSWQRRPQEAEDVFAGLSASLSGDRERGGGTIAGRLGDDPLSSATARMRRTEPSPPLNARSGRITSNRSLYDHVSAAPRGGQR